MESMEKILTEQKNSDEAEKERDREFFLQLGEIFCEK